MKYRIFPNDNAARSAERLSGRPSPGRRQGEMAPFEVIRSKTDLNRVCVVLRDNDLGMAHPSFKATFTDATELPEEFTHRPDPNT